MAIINTLGTVYLEHHPYPSDIHWLIDFSDAILTKDLTTKNVKIQVQRLMQP